MTDDTTAYSTDSPGLGRAILLGGSRNTAGVGRHARAGTYETLRTETAQHTRPAIAGPVAAPA